MAPTRLVIVESPAKCSKIQGFLGSSYQVVASLGHIRALKEELEAVGLERDFEPQYEFLKDTVKARAIQQLKEAAKGKDIIYLAADDDREGEFIAYSVSLLLKLDIKTTPRAIFHEITETAVKNAIANPRILDMNKVHAQQSRALLDMMIGFTMSPLLWKHVGGQGLSAGRCQTPALRLVVDKEKEITSFKSSSCWKIHGQWTLPNSNSNTSWPGDCVEELEDEDSARNFLENHVNEPKAEVKESEKRPFTENPPLPLITSTLQQQASTLFRSNLKNTMKIAQRLYEAGHITYMRTDQAVLSEEATKEAMEVVKESYGKEYIQQKKEEKTEKTEKTEKKIVKKEKKKPDDDKNKIQSQDAHEAIRPTHMEMKDLPTTEDWSTYDKKIYQLIWLRTIQSVMAPVKGERRSVTFYSDGTGESEDFPWKSNFQRTLFQGWRIASLKEDQDQEKDSQEAEWLLGESLKPGTKIEWTSLEGRPHTTNAPQRYTEATLIRDLEKKGIGRPSTFANLISTILDKKYVETKDTESRNVEILHLKLEPSIWPPTEEKLQKKMGGEKDRLVPTSLGKQILTFVLEHFDDLFQYSFTAQMEERLDKIAEGTEDSKQVLRDTWSSYKKRYFDLKTASSSSPDNQVGTTHRKDFGGGLVAVMTKKGPVLLKESPSGKKEDTVFYGWPQENPTLETLTEEMAKEFEIKKGKEKQGLTTYEGFPIMKKSGPYGEYAEWNGLRIPWPPGESVEQIQGKIAEKKQASADAKRVGIFEIRKGPYGLYMFKYTVQGPKRQFVGIPETLNLETITEAELIPIFQAGLQQKARTKGFHNNPSGGQESSRGGRGGRGGRGQGQWPRGRRGRGRGQ